MLNNLSVSICTMILESLKTVIKDCTWFYISFLNIFFGVWSGSLACSICLMMYMRYGVIFWQNDHVYSINTLIRPGLVVPEYRWCFSDGETQTKTSLILAHSSLNYT